ncbi:MAG TPA: sigma-70 family RNA polymerase sigma factor, partial [Candidatus Krumholzibacteria bacterium]|nr:sigma-70 family RNA polymerase sigma factor [Candidatus Krumholzibacteria bacterium]
MTAPDLHRTISAVWRIESPRLVAALARITRDVGLAEDMAQDALVAALEEWPKSGVPERPGAWLMTAAKRRAIDHKRHEDMRARKEEAIGRDIDARTLEGPDFDSALDDDIGDDLLRLIFTSCHPAISSEARTALTLRLLGGLTTDEIARAFLSSESTIAQRIVRAKRTIAEKKIPYEVPRGMELGARLASVLEVIYLVFNEGYTATAGDDWLRPALCE